MTMTNALDRLAIDAVKTFLRRHSVWDPHGMPPAAILQELWEHDAENCRDCTPVIIDLATDVAMALPDSVYEDPVLFVDACDRWERLAYIELLREDRSGPPSRNGIV